jgi:hypothetical protein
MFITSLSHLSNPTLTAILTFDISNSIDYIRFQQQRKKVFFVIFFLEGFAQLLNMEVYRSTLFVFCSYVSYLS